LAVCAGLKIISGGQSGADRAALDWAIARGVAYSGWCPKNRKAEDGVIPERYVLRETPSEDFTQRTEWNVRDSDGTVIFSVRPDLEGGSELTRRIALKLGKPVIHLCRSETHSAAHVALKKFIQDNQIRALNVAGPRASEEPDISAFVAEVLQAVFPY
jgi:hypothetical protein